MLLTSKATAEKGIPLFMSHLKISALLILLFPGLSALL